MLVGPGVLTRAAAVVYLKNRVSKGWSPAEEYSQAKPIPEEEKTSFRNRLVPVLVASPPQVRLQLIPTLQKILAYDFPQKWPNFLDITIQLLNAGDIASVFAGVQCLLAICKIYRFKSGENRADFDKIVGLSFPQLLNIGNSLANETSLEAGEILRTVLKVYKHAIYVRGSRAHDWTGLTSVVRPSRLPPRAADYGRLVYTVSDRCWQRATRDLPARRHR
jgi:hypothetical protein|tara:strand:+ start:7217 stop:7876 length:660 start_codon:yes stop_codon:yes gene_type:complete